MFLKKRKYTFRRKKQRHTIHKKTYKRKYQKSKMRKSLKTRKSLKMQKGGVPFQKIVHQIWFGSTVPEWRTFLFNKNRDVCRECGYEYKLWTEADRTRAFFESTYGYQQTAIQIGEESGQSRWAQVADLARIEIIYKLGGVYLDSLFEIGVDFLNKITQLGESGNYIFIGANEDPCEFNCRGYNNKKYLTNSFFAAPIWSVVLERLLSEESLEEIDLHSQYINRTTGPYYLRSGIKDDDIDDGSIYLFKTEEIYPFNVNASEYREVHPNVCLKKPEDLTESEKQNYIRVNDKQMLRKDCLEYIRHNPLEGVEPLTVYNSGLGGTWSF